MCNAQAPPPPAKKERAGNLHDEEGGFHLVEVNSPINISSTAWLLLLLAAASIIFWLIRRKIQMDTKKRQSGRDGWMDHSSWIRAGRPDVTSSHELTPIPSRPVFMQRQSAPPPDPSPSLPDPASLQLIADALSRLPPATPERRSRSRSRRHRSSSCPSRSRRSYTSGSDSCLSYDSDSTVLSAAMPRPRHLVKRPAPSPIPEEDDSCDIPPLTTAAAVHVPASPPSPPARRVAFSSPPTRPKKCIADPVSRSGVWSDASEV